MRSRSTPDLHGNSVSPPDPRPTERHASNGRGKSSWQSVLRLLRGPLRPVGAQRTQLLAALSLSCLLAALSCLYAWLAGPMLLHATNPSSLQETAPFPLNLIPPAFLETLPLETSPQGQRTWWMLVALLVATAVAQSLGSALYNHQFLKAQQGLLHQFRKKLFARLLSLPPRSWLKFSKDDLSFRVASDVQQLENLINTLFAPALKNLVSGGILLALALSLRPAMAVPIGLFLTAGIWGAFWVSSRTGQDFSRVLKTQARMAGATRNILQSLLVTRLHGAENQCENKFSIISKNLEEDQLRIRFRRVRLAAWISMLSATLMGAVLWWELRAQGRLTAQGVSFLAALAFAHKPVTSLAQSAVQFSQGIGAWHRVALFFDTSSASDPAEHPAEHPPEQTHPKPSNGAVQLTDVSFSYGPRPILQGANLLIHQGERVAIVGPNGCGKSTLLSLLLGWLTPDRGMATLLGHNLTHHWESQQLEDRHSPISQAIGQVGWVPQQDVFLDGTIAENITLGSAFDESKLSHVCIQVAAKDWIDSLSQGYRTRIRPGQESLSSGQKRQLSLARALYRSPGVMLLDEPAAHMDGANERALLNAIEASDRSCTWVVVTHRPTVWKAMDRVIGVTLEGKLEEFQFRTGPA